MIDWRRPKYRRRGERDGKIDWKQLRNKLYSGCCFSMFCCLVFLAGMIFESIKPVHDVTIYKEYKSYRVHGH